jgi:sec-independent protein translocase protein TatA
MPSIGPMELSIVLGIALLIFGPRKLPELGRSLGGGLREFKDSITRRAYPEIADGEAASEDFVTSHD